MVTRFAIVATQRTGSNWLMDLLNSHSQVLGYDELLTQNGKGYGVVGPKNWLFFDAYYKQYMKKTDTIARSRWLIGYLNQLYAPRNQVDAIGIKLMYDQIRHNPGVLPYIVAHRISLIHLIRENLLDIVISEAKLRASTHAHFFIGERVDNSAIFLPIDWTVRRIKALDHYVTSARLIIASLPVRHCEIIYEQLVAKPKLALSILNFLGIRPENLESKFQRINSRPTAERIINYTEVKNALVGTRYEKFL